MVNRHKQMGDDVRGRLNELHGRFYVKNKRKWIFIEFESVTCDLVGCLASHLTATQEVCELD